MCDDMNAKASSHQLRESEALGYNKVSHTTDLQNRAPDDDSKNNTDGTSHTSLSRMVEEMSCKGHDSNVNPGEMSNTETDVCDKNGGRFRCFYCNELYSNDQERVVHIDQSHPGKLYYATTEDFKNRLKPN